MLIRCIRQVIALRGVRKIIMLANGHSSIEYATSASATRSNKTGEETGQSEDPVHFWGNWGNWVGQRPGLFPRTPFSHTKLKKYHYRISLHEICGILLISSRASQVKILVTNKIKPFVYIHNWLCLIILLALGYCQQCKSILSIIRIIEHVVLLFVL